MRHDWKVQRIICHAVLQGRETECFATYAVNPIDQAIYRRIADDAVALAIRRRSAAKRYFKATIRNPIAAVLVAAAAVILGSVVAVAMLLPLVDRAQSGTYGVLGAIAGFSAIAVAAVGWGVGGWVTHRTARSKLTMDVVAARYAQAAFGDAMAAFNKQLKDRRIDLATVAAFEQSACADERRAVQGFKYLLNYFEFIAVGVLQGELDEKIVRKTLRGNLTLIHDQSLFYVTELQRRNPRTLENFSTLHRHFREP